MKKIKKFNKTIVLSALAALAFGGIAAGTTYALFTSESTTNVSVTTGKVAVDSEVVSESLKIYSGENLTGNPEEDAKNIKETANGTFTNGGTATLTGNNTLSLANMTPGDKVSFKIKVTNSCSVKVKYRTRVSLSEDTGLYGGLSIKIGEHKVLGITDWAELAVGSDEQVLECEVSLPSDKGNEYQDKNCTIAFTVEAVQGNAKTVNDIAYYNLDDFNNLTAIPDDVKDVYVYLGNKSLEGGITIGNSNIADHYQYTNYGDNTAPTGYPTYVKEGGTNAEGQTRHIYSTGKSAVNIIVYGSVQGAPDTNQFNTGNITLLVPDAANVTFKNVIFGAGQMSMLIWNESVSSSVVSHRIASVTFDGCTFNGNWMQNGYFVSEDMVIKNSTFNVHENAIYSKNSNPIWIQGMGHTNVTIDHCTINAVRPIKLWENDASGKITITNNTFNMSLLDVDVKNNDIHRNIGIMFRNTALTDVTITDNKLIGDDATALFCRDDDYEPEVPSTAVINVKDNKIIPTGAKLSAVYKSGADWELKVGTTGHEIKNNG